MKLKAPYRTFICKMSKLNKQKKLFIKDDKHFHAKKVIYLLFEMQSKEE